MVKYFFICSYAIFCFFTTGCVKTCQLSPLDLPWTIMCFEEHKKPQYGKFPEQDWLFHITLVRSFNAKAKAIIEESLASIAQVVQKQLPALPETQDPFSIITTVVDKEPLTTDADKEPLADIQLSHKQCKQIENQWRQILFAESYLLYASLITTELRSKLALYQECPEPLKFTSLINDLPQIKSYEDLQSKVNLLKKMCQLLATDNIDIIPPIGKNLQDDKQLEIIE